MVRKEGFILAVVLVIFGLNFEKSYAQTWTAQETDTYSVPLEVKDGKNVSSPVSDLEIYKISSQYKYTYKDNEPNNNSDQYIYKNQNAH